MADRRVSNITSGIEYSLPEKPRVSSISSMVEYGPYKSFRNKYLYTIAESTQIELVNFEKGALAYFSDLDKLGTFDGSSWNYLPDNSNTSGINTGDISIVDTSTINFTLVGQELSGSVLLSGIDHNQLLNYSSNRHFLQTDITNLSSNLSTGLTKVTNGTGDISIIPDNSTNWNSAYSWGDHSVAGYLLSNSLITGSTKTKITYDSKGLVTSGSDATTADISDSLNRRYVTDTQLTIIANTSGTNTGDISIVDTSSIDLSLAGQQISGVVLPGGVDHNSLLNYEANRHFLQTDIDHLSTILSTGLVKVTTSTGALSVVTDSSTNWDTAYGWGNHASAGYALASRTISEGAGLAGNSYDLSANRTLAMGTPSSITSTSTNSASGTTHTHAADSTLARSADVIANTLLTTRGDIIRRSATAPERYGLVLPTSPRINYFGVESGELDPTWKSASSNPGATANILQSDASGYLELVRLGIGIAPTSALHLASATTAAGGITFGSDVELYRSAANVLKLNDSFVTNTNSISALKIEQSGVKDNVLVVNTSNAWVSVNKTTELGWRSALQVYDSAYGAISVSNKTTDEITLGRFIVPNFTKTNLPIQAFGAAVFNGTATAQFGGGSTTFNTVSDLKFYTDSITDKSSSPSGGTLRMWIDSNGLITMYDGGLVVNENGSTTGDTRFESDTESNMYFLDASADVQYFGGTTNGVKITKGGDIELLGTAKYERHIQIEASPSGNPASQMSPVTVGTATGLQASSNVDQYAGCQWEIPDDWDGTDCYIEADWFPDSGSISGTAAVRWVVEYRSIAEGELITKGTVATVDNGAGGDTTDYPQYTTKHTRFTLPYNHTNQPLTAQDHIYFLIHRDTGVANDYSGTVVITAFEVIYNSKGLPTSN